MSIVVKLREEFDGPPPPPPPEPPPEGGQDAAPVAFLGQQKGTFWFFDHMGQLRDLQARQLAMKAEIVALFGAAGARWLAEEFPAFDKEGNPTGDFKVSAVNLWIVEQSARVKLFDPSTPRRGVGLWRAGDVAALHLGDRILWGDTWRSPGFRDAGALWPAHPPAAQAAAPATPQDCRNLEGLLARWHWRDPLAEQVVFGLWAAGMMGAAIPWRPHGFIVGEQGSGKSTLFELLGLANPLALTVNDYTKAGIEQTMGAHASAVLLDEADATLPSEMDRLTAVIGLLRRASGLEGAKGVRGSPGGESRRIEVVAAFLMGAILPPTFEPQDASRITRVDLLRRADGGPPLPSARDRAWVRERGPAFLARAVQALPRFPGAFAAVREQLLAQGGQAPRVADQIGAILAARWVMLEDGPVPPLGDEMSALSWAIPSAETQQSEGGPAQALQHLLTSMLDLHRNGERPNVARTILAARDTDTAGGDDARRQLVDHGMRLGPYPLNQRDGPLVLYVMNQHQQLARMFAGTRWAGGKWREDLARLPGAFRPEGSVKLASGQKVRCVVIPGELLPRRGDEGTGGDTS